MSTEAPHLRVDVTNGQNIIRIVSDGYGSCLVIRSACVVNWPDCRGSVGKFYAHARYPDGERQRLTHLLDESLRSGTEAEILSCMPAFLQLFENGMYTAEFYTIRLQDSEFHESGMVHGPHVPKNERFSGGYYPMAGQDYFYTLLHDRMDQERIDYYVQEIQRGARPKVVVYSSFYEPEGDWSPNYIIDGHHKMKAYLRLGIDAPCLSIYPTVTKWHTTAEMLRLSYPVLQDFEFAHLFKNADLRAVDFPNDTFLTGELYGFLHADHIGMSLVLLLRKYAASKDPAERAWYDRCIGHLEAHPHLGFWGKGIIVACQKPHEKWGMVWTTQTIGNRSGLRSWIAATIACNESPPGAL